MGNSRAHNVPQILETDGGQEQNHPEQPPVTATARASRSRPPIYPTITIQGGPSPTSAPTSNGHQGSILNADLMQNEIEAPDSVHIHADTNSSLVPNNHLPVPSPTSLGPQTSPGADEGFHDHTVDGVSQKRKSPFIHELCGMGSTSKYYDGGSSSNSHLPDGASQLEQNAASHPMPWENPPGNVQNSLSISSESTMRNVRSRSNVDRTPFSSNFQNLSSAVQSSDQTGSVDFHTQSSNTSTTELGGHISQAGNVATMGNAHFGQNTPSSVNGHSNVSEESGGNSNNGTLSSNTIPQISSSDLNRSSASVHRPVPTYGASSNNFEVVRTERQMRLWIPSDRYRYRPSNREARLLVHRSELYEASNDFDEHDDMRLDVENMSYEELLSLGESIGNVSTGLSNDQISKCLTESSLCSSDHSGGDGRCVICLEEYKDLDNLGNLKCGHDFHVGCVRKWLSDNKVCPICKASAMDEDNEKEE